MYDVLIVGAGPAGNVAALELAKRGFRVGALDYRERIGDKLCTGIIGVECAREFPPSPSIVYREASSAVIHSPAGRSYAVGKQHPQAVVLDREAYVNEIATRAQAQGAEYHIGWRAVGVVPISGGARVLARRGSVESRFDARLLMVASGFRSPLARAAGFDGYASQKYVVGQQAVVETNGVDEVEVFIGGEEAPDSIGWLVPTSDTRALLGFISRRAPIGHLDSMRDRLLNEGKLVGRQFDFQRWGIPLEPLSRTYAERALALGDAAGFTKPTTGGGIYYAMLSGRIAALTAAESLESGDFSARALQPYERRWKREFGSEMRVGYCARLVFEAMSDAQKEDVMETFLSPDVQREVVANPEFSFDRHGGAILRTVGHRRIARIVAGFGPVVAPLFARLVRAAAFG